VTPGNFLRAGDLQPLAMFQRVDELRRFQHAFVGTGVKPGEAAAHRLDVKLAALEVSLIHARDLEFPPFRGCYTRGDVADLGVVEVQAGHCEMTLRPSWLLFDRQRLALRV